MNKKNHHQKQQNYFDTEFASVKEYVLVNWKESYIKKIKKYVLDKNYKHKTLVDIGTGTGYVAIEMAKLGLHVIACDLSSQAIKNLEHYKKRFGLSTLELIQCKAEDLPLPTNSVDYLVANAILEHIPDEKKVISEWKRILRPGGRMFITVPLKFRYIWPFLWPINYLHDRRIGHLRRYDLETLQEKFALKVITHFYTGHLVKIFSIILSIVLKTNVHEIYFEKLDGKKRYKRYGASNISVIFEKPL